jgi:hypothetical protein
MSVPDAIYHFRTTEVYFVRQEEDAAVAARRIQIRVTGRQSE